MKYPKKVRTYCPKCRKQTEHTIKQGKKKTRDSAHPMSQSANRKDRHKRGYGGHGKYSKPAVSKKPTQKIDMRLVCSECGKAHSRPGFRVKKFEVG